jgi:uncharacterized membrane protein YGL010W
VTIAECLAWQWSDYPAKHRSRLNLVIHIVAVPPFMLGCLAVVLGIVEFALAQIVGGLGAIVVSVVLEGIGHRFEAERPAPFAGFGDFVKRFFLEQWVTFPRFVLSGRYFLNLAGPGRIPPFFRRRL